MKLKNHPQRPRLLIIFLLLLAVSGYLLFAYSYFRQANPELETEISLLDIQAPPILFKDNDEVREYFADSGIEPSTSRVIRRECTGRWVQTFYCAGKELGSFYIYVETADGEVHRFHEWEFHFLLHPSHSIVPYRVELGNHTAYLDLYERPSLTIEAVISRAALGSIDGDSERSIYVYGLHFDAAGEGIWFVIEFYRPSVNQRGMAWIYRSTTALGFVGDYYTRMPGLPIAYYLETALERVNEEGQYIGTIPAGTVLFVDVWLACGDISGYGVSYIADNQWIDALLPVSAIDIPEQDVPYIFYAPCGA